MMKKQEMKEPGNRQRAESISQALTSQPTPATSVHMCSWSLSLPFLSSSPLPSVHSSWGSKCSTLN